MKGLDYVEPSGYLPKSSLIKAGLWQEPKEESKENNSEEKGGEKEDVKEEK